MKKLLTLIMALAMVFSLAACGEKPNDDTQKEEIINCFLPLLNDCGEILIGDVAFNTRAEWEQCRADSGAAWDDDEIYFVFDEIKRHFPKMTFERMSYCSGVLMLCK